jgi:thiamine-phosphate pyrophosphorylase
MKLILLTGSDGLRSDPGVITEALQKGFSRVHIRVYDQPIDLWRKFLKSFSDTELTKMVIHDHYELVDEFNLGGIHIPSWRRIATDIVMPMAKCVSTSVHSIGELAVLKGYNYCFLGPIYNSISKPGYMADPNISTSFNIDMDVFAIGGIRPEHLTRISDTSFAGAGILGGVWNDDPISSINKYINVMKGETVNG